MRKLGNIYINFFYIFFQRKFCSDLCKFCSDLCKFCRHSSHTRFGNYTDCIVFFYTNCINKIFQSTQCGPRLEDFVYIIFGLLSFRCYYTKIRIPSSPSFP